MENQHQPLKSHVDMECNITLEYKFSNNIKWRCSTAENTFAQKQFGVMSTEIFPDAGLRQYLFLCYDEYFLENIL